MDSKDADITSQIIDFYERSKKERYVLRLFVTGMTARSADSIARVKSLCEQYLRGRYELEIIDIYQQPELASAYQIIAVPTLVKNQPAPIRRLIGDFSDVDKVLRGLDIRTNTRNSS